VITARIRRQLVVFGVLSLSAALMIVFVYAHLPTVFGYHQMRVSAVFSDGAGVYTNGNVTLRGVQIGKITGVSLDPHGVRVDMSVRKDADIGADSRAEIHSVSAVGEQYVDFISRQKGGPYLRDGAVVPVSRTAVPSQIADVLDHTDTMLASIPADGLRTFLTEGSKAFANLGPALGSLADSSQSLVDEANANYAQTHQLIDSIGPLLDTQTQTAGSIQNYFRYLANFTGVLRDGDGHLRDALPGVSRAATQAGDFLDDNRYNAPILAANLRTVGQVFGVYRPPLETLFTKLPVLEGWLQIWDRSPDGVRAVFQTEFDEGCSAGYHSDHTRGPDDLTDVPPDKNTYCNVPHNDPRVVRGARNIPCLEGNTKLRAALLDQCFGREPQPGVPGGAGTGPTVAPTQPLRTPMPETGPFSGTPSNPNGADPLAAFGGTSTPAQDPSWQSLMTPEPGN
jgi:phospholipid/cholesterol/gamma-HCH transport system substrate-binding protein